MGNGVLYRQCARSGEYAVHQFVEEFVFVTPRAVAFHPAVKVAQGMDYLYNLECIIILQACHIAFGLYGGFQFHHAHD